MMLKKLIAVAVALPFVATAALAEGGCNSMKMTQQTPAPVASAPQTPAPTTAAADKVEIAQAPQAAQPAVPKTN